MEGANKVNSDSEFIKTKYKNRKSTTFANIGDRKFQVNELRSSTLNDYGMPGYKTVMQYKYTIKNAGNKTILSKFAIEESDTYGDDATYLIDGNKSTMNAYHAKRSNMRKLMNPENFKKVIDSELEKSNKKNRAILI